MIDRNYKYISGVVTDGFALCEDLRLYLADELKEGIITIRTTQSATKVILDSPTFKSIDAHYVCLTWDNVKNKIDFAWRNDKGEVHKFSTLSELINDIVKTVRSEIK